MVRSYKKKTERAEINEDDVSKAMKAALEGNLSIRKAALMFNIKPATLQHRLEKMKARNGEERVRDHGSKYSSQQVFTAKQEKQLNEYLVKCNELHHGLTLKQMRRLAYEFAEKLRCKYPESWNGNEMAGEDWMYGFRSRNANLSLRKPEKTSIMRCVGFRRAAVEEFFNNYESAMKRYNFARHRMFNFDETGITTVLDTPKVLASKHQRQVGQVVSAERGELVTFGAFISATGNQYPPVFIFPRVHYKDHFIAGAPEGSLGLASRSGWMTADLFLIVLRHIKEHTNSSIENRILLICDNHESHVSIEAIDYCRANGIVYLSFPPHTSHKLQPLDVAVCGPFKAKLKIAFNDWHLNNPGKHLSIYDIPKLAKLAYLESFTPKNIVSGFEKTGIVPFNRLVFSNSDFSPSTVSIPHSHSDTVVVTPPQTDSATPSTVSQSQDSNVPQSADATQAPRPTTCSNTPVTPEDVRPYPTASGSRTNKRKGRQPGKSRIYTDSPEKKRLFDMRKVKEEKQAAAQQRNRNKEVKNAKMLLGIEDTKPLKRQTKRKKVEDLYSSDESETSLGQLCDSTSDDLNLSDLLGEEADTLEEDTTEEADTSDQNIVDGDYVIVRFAKKRSVVHFVGQVKGKTDDGDHLVRFMNRKPGNFFIFPEKEDNSGVEVPDMTKLPQPTATQGTARTSGRYTFNFDFDSFNIPYK